MLTAVVTAALALTACSGGEAGLALGETAPLEADAPLAVGVAVLSVTQSTLEDSGLTGLFGTSIEGVPWFVGYRLDLTSGTREDFSWDAVTDMTTQAWTADADRAGDIVATNVQGGGAQELPCAERGQETPEGSIGYYCQLFMLPEGASIDSIQLADVATWSVEGSEA
ncbi:hypothetical protein [Cellulomonas endometrii]|uniref:hypothetical protein n=1 Tax=Cellulomonas endometrii TaxID=3036301 RepID=UPI0024AD563E|nr:hypothetical protein [Cellulomonas endometrii]